MAHCITAAPRKPGAAPVPPLKPDGLPYEWGIWLPGHTRLGWADSIEELVGILTGEPGYSEMAPREQAYHRIMEAVRLQVVTQARINLIAQTVRDDWQRACEWERRVLNGPRHVQPHGFESAGLFGGRDVWTCPIPLILVATGFAPYSPVEPVQGSEGNVWWIDPSTDITFLESLLAEPLGLIRLWRLGT